MFSSLAPYFQIFKSVSDLELLEAVRRPTGTGVLPPRRTTTCRVETGYRDELLRGAAPDRRPGHSLGHVPASARLRKKSTRGEEGASSAAVNRRTRETEAPGHRQPEDARTRF
jgi:hypothetical protein